MEYELSYLIRMGAGKHPQCRDRYWEGFACDADVSRITATCALGAAMVALSTLHDLHIVSAQMAIVGVDPSDVVDEIPYLNDHERLTREEIADRLDALPGGSPRVEVPYGR